MLVLRFGNADFAKEVCFLLVQPGKRLLARSVKEAVTATEIITREWNCYVNTALWIGHRIV